jgi:hypothetical protein
MVTMLVTSNRSVGEWDRILKVENGATTVVQLRATR